ncbi:MAG: hypothetical protein FJ272_05735 [Planctomycetes bacterium]|nr:hypothetical protein [Planctomycetota bacterium]
MEESIFEQIKDETISLVVNWGALGTVVLGVVLGLLVAKVRKRYPKDLIYGLMLGLIGPCLCLFWHLYDARTSYWDWLYQDKNPGTYLRLFWIDRASATETVHMADTDVLLGKWQVTQFWKFVQPYPLWSVYSLVTMLVWTIIAAVVIGVVAGLIIRAVERKWPSPASQAPAPEAPSTAPAPPAAS